MAQNVSPDEFSNSNSKLNTDAVGGNVDSHAVAKRLNKELMNLMMGTEKGISAFPDNDNIFKWIGTIVGPPDSMYAGHKYRVSLEFTQSYPFLAPNVRFITPCFHPNIDKNGNICLDILKEKWSALYEVRTILLSLQALLAEPNNMSPLNLEASTLYENSKEFKTYVAAFYEKHKDD